LDCISAIIQNRSAFYYILIQSHPRLILGLVEGARRKRPGRRQEDGTATLPSTALHRQASHVILTGEGAATWPAVAFVFAKTPTVVGCLEVEGVWVWRSRRQRVCTRFDQSRIFFFVQNAENTSVQAWLMSFLAVSRLHSFSMHRPIRLPDHTR